jgi:hypothetical protein
MSHAPAATGRTASGKSLDPGRPAFGQPTGSGSVSDRCRALEEGLLVVRRAAQWYIERYDQRLDDRWAGVLAAADEVVRSCWQEAFERSGSMTGSPGRVLVHGTGLPHFRLRRDRRGHPRRYHQSRHPVPPGARSEDRQESPAFRRVPDRSFARGGADPAARCGRPPVQRHRVRILGGAGGPGGQRVLPHVEADSRRARTLHDA